MKILVVGIGGIGGFFGGFLHESGADVTFLVRPKREKIVSANGLKIISSLGNIHIKPNLILAKVNFVWAIFAQSYFGLTFSHKLIVNLGGQT